MCDLTKPHFQDNDAAREDLKALRRPVGTGCPTTKATIEVDETFTGRDKTIELKCTMKGRSYHYKYKVLTLVGRGDRLRSQNTQPSMIKPYAPS